MGYRPLCPNCESSLSLIVERDEETNKINFIITCEWCDEYEGFMIKTDIKVRDIRKFAKLKKASKIEAEIVPLDETEKERFLA